MGRQIRFTIVFVTAALIFVGVIPARGTTSECEVLPPPAEVEIVDTPCGGTTQEISPRIEWQPVDNTVHYVWTVQAPDGTVVDTGLADTTFVVVGPLDGDTYVASVQAHGDGEAYCDSEWSESCPFTVVVGPEPAAFTWWPEQPKAGERVRFVDLITDLVLSWFWDFGDGETSEQQHPTHVFDGPGDYIVTRDVELDSGHVIEEKTITVAGVVECGNSVCESGETAWNCPADCALEPGETGRAPASDHRPTVPAAAGGLHSIGIWIHNPGPVQAALVAGFTASGAAASAQTGPFLVEPGQSLFWADAIPGFFGGPLRGALSLDSSSPVLLRTRSSTARNGEKKMPQKGPVGQDLSGIPERLTIGSGDGALYLPGLRRGLHHDSLLHLHEIDGSEVTARVDVFNNRGRQIGQTTIALPGGAAESMRLARLGLRRGWAWAAVEVVAGDGRLAVSGSLVDLRTGDHLAVPAFRGAPAHPSKSGETHQLVALALHRKGQFSADWRSGLAITNPTGASQTARLVYESEFSHGPGFGDVLETVITVRPGRQLVWNDVITELFGVRSNVKTQGSLHIFHSGDLLVDARVLNRRKKGGAVGANLPALGAGDMIRVGETGVMIGLVHTPFTRASLGLSEFSGQEARVEVAVYSTASGPNLLGAEEFSVPASSHLGIGNFFERFGLDANPSQPLVVEVTTIQGGSVSPYVMTVDTKSGDPAIHLAARK